MKNRLSFIAAAFFLLIIPTGCSDTYTPLTAPLSELYPVDGAIDFSALQNVNTKTVSFVDETGQVSGKSTTVTWSVMNDDAELYVAVAWTDDTRDHEYTFSGPVSYDAVQLCFDNDGDGTYEQMEDQRIVMAADAGAYYIDAHAADGDGADEIGDGRAWLFYLESEKKYQAEFLFPLASDARGEDAAVSEKTRFTILIYDNVRLADGTGSVASTGADTVDTGTWQKITLTEEGPFERPAPDTLTGLITFTSTHEDARGEIYTFDPATDTVTRVTRNDFFEENVSLSHDRTRIAFHGAPERDDYSHYEIYTINADGTSLKQLTDNGFLDGHPGWSPDDTLMAYSSFRRSARASIIVMTAGGAEVADLTPPEYDDNDADFLPDGRIVFKTNRFSTLPELRIAVMDEDGGNVQQLTGVSGVVDHDPMGNDTGVVFERLMAPLSYTDDIEALFTPWNIIEVNLADKAEQTLVSDTWINWLPV